MRQLYVEIAGVDLSWFDSDAILGPHYSAPIIDFSSIGGSISLDSPIGTSSEFTFSIPRWGENQDLYQIFNKLTEKTLPSYSMLLETVHLNGTSIKLTTPLAITSRYIHIQTECLDLGASWTSPLPANTAISVKRGALGTRPLPFFVSNNSLSQVAVTADPCYWKGRVFNIYLAEPNGTTSTWYKGLLTTNPFLSEDKISFAGVFLENIVSGDLFNCMESRTTTLAPYIHTGGKVSSFVSAREAINLGSVRLISGQPTDNSNYWSGSSLIEGVNWPSTTDKEYARNIAPKNTSDPTPTTIRNLNATVSTSQGDYDGVVLGSDYDSISHGYKILISLPAQSNSSNIDQYFSVTCPAVCGAYTQTYPTFTSPQLLTLPTVGVGITGSNAINFHAQIFDAAVTHLCSEGDNPNGNPYVHNCYAVTPYTWKTYKYILIAERYHTKDEPSVCDCGNAKKYFKLRGWEWCTGRESSIAALYGDNPTQCGMSFMYPFHMVTTNSTEGLLSDEVVQITNGKHKVQQDLIVYSLRVDKDKLANHCQRRELSYEVAETFWEQGMPMLYLLDDFATRESGAYFKVKWQERHGEELEGLIKLQRYPALDYASTYYAYMVKEATYDENNSLVGFGTWSGLKDCEIIPCSNVFSTASEFAIDLLASCEGVGTNDWDVFPFGYNVSPDDIDQGSILSISGPFDNISFTEPTSGENEEVLEFVKQYLLLTNKGLVGKHSNGYKIGAIDLAPLSGTANYTFNDDAILTTPTIGYSEPVYTRYEYKIDKNTKITCIDRTAEANFGTDTSMGFDLTHYIKNSEYLGELNGICSDISAQLHEIFGYPQKVISFSVHFDKVYNINLGDSVSITSAYLDGPINGNKTYTGRLISYSHDIKAGVSSLQISCVEKFFEGYNYSFTLDFNPGWVTNAESGTPSGLSAWFNRMTTVNMQWHLYIGKDNYYNGVYGIGAEAINNYAKNSQTMSYMFKHGITADYVVIWVEGFWAYCVAHIDQVIGATDIIHLVLTTTTVANSGTLYLPTDNTSTYRLNVLFNNETQLFQLETSEVGL